MRLISMTDFVLHESFGVGNEIINKEVFYNKCINYAQFLKQTLQLGMFVPCDEEGNVLEQPKQTSLTCSFFEHQQFFNKQKKYEKAKEKVFFKGFDEDSANMLMYYNDNIEHIVYSNITLTENALKQIGL